MMYAGYQGRIQVAKEDTWGTKPSTPSWNTIGLIDGDVTVDEGNSVKIRLRWD